MLGAMFNTKPVNIGKQQVYLAGNTEIRKRETEIKRIKALSRSGLNTAQIARIVERSMWYVNSVLSGGFAVVPSDYVDDPNQKSGPRKLAAHAQRLIDYQAIKNMQKSGKSLRAISAEFNKDPSWASQVIRKVERDQKQKG